CRKLRHHLLLGEKTEVAAVGSTGVLGLLLGKLGEIRALVELSLDLLGFVLGVDQDMAGMHLFLARNLLGGFVIDLLHGLVGGSRLALGGEQAVHQQPVLGERHPLLEVVGIFDLLVLGGLGDDLHV